MMFIIFLSLACSYDEGLESRNTKAKRPLSDTGVQEP